jgi:hypothetical protein
LAYFSSSASRQMGCGATGGATIDAVKSLADMSVRDLH